MDTLIHVLFLFGLGLPVLAWLTLIIGYIERKMTGKGSSGILIPVIGPVLLNICSLQMNLSGWTYVIPWVADISTVLFIRHLPSILREIWGFSKYTELLALQSKIGIQTANLSLHKNNLYIIRFTWLRKEDECGIIATNDFGTYQAEGDTKYILTSHTGNTIILEKDGDVYRCTDSRAAGYTNVDGYEFSRHIKLATL